MSALLPKSQRRQSIILSLPAVLAGVLYLSTMSPGVVGFDSAELITGAHTLGIVHPTGYPLYLLLGKLFTFIPVRSIAYRVNLLSVCFGVIAVFLAARWIYGSTRSFIASWAGALSLALNYGMWSMATVAEVYTLQVALLLALLISMRYWLMTGEPRWLYLMAFLFGLSMTNHVTAALFLPSLGFLIISKLGFKQSLKQAPILVGAVAIGLAFYLYLPLRYNANPPLNYVKSYYKVDLTTLSGMIWMVSGKAYRFFAFGYDLPGYAHELVSAAVLLTKNFTVLGVVLGIAGMGSMLRTKRNEAIALLLAFVLNILFFAGYAVADKDTMFLPAFGIWALLIGFGVYAMGTWISSLVLLNARERITARQILAGGLLASYLIIGNKNMQWVDRSGDLGADLYARRVLSTLPEGSFVIGRWSSAVILEYYQYVEGVRPDIHIFNRSRYEVAMYYDLWKDGVPHPEAVAQILAIEEGIINAFAEERQVFDAEYNPYLAQYYEYQPVGQVFRLVPRQEG